METPDLIRAARQQSLGDLPRRSARRLPDKVAIIDGDVRLTFAELDAAVDRTAAAMADAGLAKGDRLALLCHNCWQFAVLDFATARIGVVLVPVNFMLGADEIAFILERSGAKAFVVEDALVPTADRALQAILGGSVAAKRVVRLAGGEVPDGWARSAGLARARRGAAGSAGRGRRPDPDDVHLRHRVPAQGCAALEPVAAVAVRHLRGGRRVQPGRHRPALAAALPLRAARRASSGPTCGSARPA